MVVPEGTHESEGKCGALKWLLIPPSHLDPPGDLGGEGLLAGEWGTEARDNTVPWERSSKKPTQQCGSDHFLCH